MTQAKNKQNRIEKIKIDDVPGLSSDTLNSLRGRMNQLYVPEFKKRYIAVTGELWGRGEEIASMQADDLMKEDAVIEPTIWSRRYVNDLPDTAFGYIEKIGDITKRHFPYKNNEGKIDMPHLRNALDIVQKSTLSDEAKEQALRKLRTAAKKVGVSTKKRADDFFIESTVDGSEDELFAKADEDEHIVTGVVYAPDETDSQGHFAKESVIRDAAHSFMTSGQSIYFQHKVQMYDASVLESWIAPQNLKIEKVAVKKGSWVMSVRVWSDEVWQAIKNGEITGFSLRGNGTLVDRDDTN